MRVVNAVAASRRNLLLVVVLIVHVVKAAAVSAAAASGRNLLLVVFLVRAGGPRPDPAAAAVPCPDPAVPAVPRPDPAVPRASVIFTFFFIFGVLVLCGRYNLTARDNQLSLRSARPYAKIPIFPNTRL
uniref:Uncharacterized protein n=1 Tax=Oryza nivara TaxID=4536 RepID=A0A0E0I7X6_ORYNI